MDFNNPATRLEGVIDVNYINKKLEDINDFLVYMGNVEPSAVTDEIKSQMHNPSEKIRYLFENSAKNNIHKRHINEHKIHESLWSNDILLRYLYEGYITYSNTNKDKLYCSVCSVDFHCSPSLLRVHLTDQSHFTNYSNAKFYENNNLWKNIHHCKQNYEKFITYKDDNTLYCKICGVVIPSFNINLMGHFNSKMHLKKFKLLIDSDRNAVKHNESVDPSVNLLNSHDKKSGVQSNENINEIKDSKKVNEKNKQQPKIASKYLINVTHNSFNKYCNINKLKKSPADIKTWIRLQIFLNYKTGSERMLDIIEIIKHEQIMNEVNKNPYIFKIYCLMCDYFILSGLNCMEPSLNLLIHVRSPEHSNCIDNYKKINIFFDSYEWYYCKDCFISFFCYSEFYSFHLSSKQHRKMCSKNA